jgi:hypothetical protein
LFITSSLITTDAASMISTGAACTFTHYPNACIEYNDDEALTGVSVAECKAACCSRVWCNSFDYYKNSNQCDLSAAAAWSHSLLQLSNFDHYSISCDASPPPANGGVGNCTSSLTSGASCAPTCDSGYTVSGTSSCVAGNLTAATCSVTCASSTNSTKDGSDGSFYCIHGTVGGTAGQCQCACNAGYEGTGCDTASACTASSNSTKDGSDGTLHCVNGGDIGGSTGSCTCTSCDTGYEGDNCQTFSTCAADLCGDCHFNDVCENVGCKWDDTVPANGDVAWCTALSPPPPNTPALPPPFPPPSPKLLVLADYESSASRYSALSVLAVSILVVRRLRPEASSPQGSSPCSSPVWAEVILLGC